MKRTIIALGIGSALAAIAAVQQSAKERSAEITKTFAPFSPSVKTRSDDQLFYVESDGIPDHELMVGIVAWQQQVPLPQPYRGSNSWSFPLFPKPAEKPMSAKTNFFRGAIAIAANGVPIFNPIKNDGRTDTYIAGELDKFGGHCGRGDDYHYHIAPLHLIAQVGKDTPIAYALDGYPIYGLTCSNGETPSDLDEFNGHSTSSRGYHYHATKNYPYLNGGFHGVVVEKGGQVDPQPRAQGVRPALPPLRGAKIVAFKKIDNSRSQLSYEMGGKTYMVDYSWDKEGVYTFKFIDPEGFMRTETYRSSPPPRGNDAKSVKESGRKPWILQHCPEIDTNKDKSVTLAELEELVKAAYKEVAGTAQSISIDALKSARPARNVIGGYLKGHAAEFDKDKDGSATLQEIVDEFASLFHKSDPNHDHVLTEDEYGGK